MADDFSASECLARAALCDEEADRADSATQRAQLRWLAEQWRGMAKLAERFARSPNRLH
jgi:hypothetical protein